MKKQWRIMVAASLLTMGLTACNANQDARMDPNMSETYGTNNYEPGTYGTNTTRNGLTNDRQHLTLDQTNNNRLRNGIDHNGPLTEDYEKEPGDLDFGTRRWDDFDYSRSGRGNGIDRYGTYHDRGQQADANLSSFSTNRSSKDYPHTRAILVREAKYQYVPAKDDGRKWSKQKHQAAPEHGQQQQEQTKAPNQGNTQNQAQQQAPAGISAEAQQVIDLTNEQRQQNGLAPLTADPQLSGVALKKSEDMQQNGYFSHTSPTYGSPFDMMRDFGISYNSAGENIAQGQRTPQEVVQAWMDSPGHRKNILSPDFTHIGVGHAETGHHWTQMFISK